MRTRRKRSSWRDGSPLGCWLQLGNNVDQQQDQGSSGGEGSSGAADEARVGSQEGATVCRQPGQSRRSEQLSVASGGKTGAGIQPDEMDGEGDGGQRRQETTVCALEAEPKALDRNDVG